MILCIVDYVDGYASSNGIKLKTGETLAGVSITAGGVGIIAAAVSISVFTVKFVAEGYIIVLWIFLNISAALLAGISAGIVIGLDCLLISYTNFDDLVAQVALAVAATGLLAIGNVISYLPKKSGYIQLD